MYVSLNRMNSSYMEVLVIYIGVNGEVLVDQDTFLDKPRLYLGRGRSPKVSLYDEFVNSG